MPGSYPPSKDNDHSVTLGWLNFHLCFLQFCSASYCIFKVHSFVNIFSNAPLVRANQMGLAIADFRQQTSRQKWNLWHSYVVSSLKKNILFAQTISENVKAQDLATPYRCIRRIFPGWVGFFGLSTPQEKKAPVRSFNFPTTTIGSLAPPAPSLK